MDIPQDMRYYLDRKYDILQQNADANTAAAQAKGSSGPPKIKGDGSEPTIPFPTASPAGVPNLPTNFRMDTDPTAELTSRSLGLAQPGAPSSFDAFRPRPIDGTPNFMPLPMSSSLNGIGQQVRLTPQVPDLSGYIYDPNNTSKLFASR